MRKHLTIILTLLIGVGIALYSPMAYTQVKQLDTEEALEDALLDKLGEDKFDFEEEEEPPIDEELPIEEEEAEIEPVYPRLPFSRPPPRRPRPETFVGEGEEEADLIFKVIIDMTINASYVFNNSPESFDVKYHVQVESNRITTNTSVWRGKAKIEANVKGFLAKWDTGECKLAVNIKETPFTATVRRMEEEKLDISFRFPTQIQEAWTSNCTFTEGKPFITSGEPEKWFQRALAKASPPLAKLIANVSDGEKQTTEFVISEHTFNDPPLGNVQVSGNGKIIVTAGSAIEAAESTAE